MGDEMVNDGRWEIVRWEIVFMLFWLSYKLNHLTIYHHPSYHLFRCEPIMTIHLSLLSQFVQKISKDSPLVLMGEMVDGRL